MGRFIKNCEVIVFIFFIVVPCVAHAQGFKVAIVDLRKILAESIRGKEAKSLLEKEMKEKKEVIETKKNELQKLMDELEKQRLILSDKALQEKQKLITEKSTALQTLVMQYQQELQQKDQELTKSIINEVSGIVEEIARKKGITLVIEKNEGGVLYAKNGMDITDIVLNEYDRRVRKKKR